ncbi:MAG: hypothetical protein ABIJ18_00170 [archaeon]
MLALCFVATPVLAAESSNYDFDYFAVADINADNGTIYVERGDNVPVTVYFYGTGNTTDVNLKVWIGGYEYDYTHTASEMFDVEDGVWYRKVLNLQLPDDMNAEDEYTLYLEMYDDDDYIREEATIMVSKTRHDVRIQDVIVDNSTEAGDYTSVTVRLENMGDKKEEDLRVQISSEDLGIEVATYLDELTNNEIDNEDEEESGDVSLNFKVDNEALTGAYDLEVTVTYNNGYSTVSETAVLNVNGAQEDAGEVTVTVSDATEEESKDFSTALKLGFGILAVLIVILALILIVRR